MSNAQQPFIAPPDPPPAPYPPGYMGQEDSSLVDSVHFWVMAIVIIALFIAGVVLICISMQSAVCPSLR